MRATVLAAALATLAATPQASAHTVHYFADLIDINRLGASGRADLSLDTHANTLNVRISARGLDADQVHIQHIHGTFAGDGDAPAGGHHHGGGGAPAATPAGTPTDAITPTLERGADTDGDGFVELGEGVPFYGPVLFNLNDESAGLDGFPTAPGGVIDFDFTYDLTASPSFAAGFSMADLFPLEFREIVIHGAFTSARDGMGTGGEVNGVGGYKLVLPVLAGEIQRADVAPVPLPAAAWMLLAALGGLGVMRRRAG
jgi:hypothetical protein